MLFFLLLRLLLGQLDGIYIGRIEQPTGAQTEDACTKIVQYGSGISTDGKTLGILNPKYVLMTIPSDPYTTHYICEDTPQTQ